MKKAALVLVVILLTLSIGSSSLAIETIYRNGKTETLTIPDELEGYPVRYISTDALSDCPQITELTLPATLTAVGGQQLPNLQRIVVGEGNESLKTEDGVLFTADGKRLIQYPAADSRRSYAIPEGVREIVLTGIHICSYGTDITIDPFHLPA